MPFICIPQEKIDSFRQALKSKELNIKELMDMSTQDRITLFEKFAGENAKIMNNLFEEKLILKNRLQGIKNWASKVGEIGRYDPTKKAALDAAISNFKAQQQERIFSPAENQSFLSSLVEKALGTEITREQAKEIFDLQKKADDLKKKFDTTTPRNERTPEQQKAALEYGAAQVSLEKYTELLKSGDLGLKDLIKKLGYDTKQEFSVNKIKSVGNLLLKTVKFIKDNSVSMVATFDNSFLGRQGLHTLMTHPTIWSDMAVKSFKDIYTTLGGKDSSDALMADVYSRPNFINGEYTDAKLIPKTEEQFPTTFPEKIPGVARIYKAAENAFNGSAIRSRIDLYDMLRDKAVKNGAEMDKTQVQDLGRLVGSLTAKGSLGKIGESALVKTILWAPRMLKANWDVLTAHTGGFGLETDFARQEAAINLAKIVAETAGLIMIANALKPGSAETNPTSSDFGKIKIGNTTFDYTGGAGSLITLAARIITNSSKSTSTGITKPLGGGFGQKTGFDVLIDFLTGKTTPPVSAIITLLKRATPTGQKPTIAGSLYSGFTPISIQNAIQLKDDHSVSAVLGVLLDGLGINASTHPKTQADWSQNPTAELQQFRIKVGDSKFKEANNLFNQEYNNWLTDINNNPRFQSLSDTDKQRVITAKKANLKTEILKQYHFIYNSKPKKPLPKF